MFVCNIAKIVLVFDLQNHWTFTTTKVAKTLHFSKPYIAFLFTLTPTCFLLVHLSFVNQKSKLSNKKPNYLLMRSIFFFCFSIQQQKINVICLFYQEENKSESKVLKGSIFYQSGGRSKNRSLNNGSEPILYHLDWKQIAPSQLSLEKNISCLNGRMKKVIYEVLLKKTGLLENKWGTVNETAVNSTIKIQEPCHYKWKQEHKMNRVKMR